MLCRNRLAGALERPCIALLLQENALSPVVRLGFST